jgi:sigma-B regulation protein RsbU (phosphoserine phosphatase)
MSDETSRDACRHDAAVVALTRLIQQHRDELIRLCRDRILEWPQLRSAVEQFQIESSDDWLHQALSLFTVCTRTPGPAAEWHDEVGELNFAAGMSVADASTLLGIFRDAVLDVIQDAVETGEVPQGEFPLLLRALLAGFDCALAAQASAYVRESNRHLTQVNRQLELRQQTFERDLALAKLVQQQFIPRQFKSDQFRADVRYVPTASIGGDHAGIFPVSPERVYVTICDVTGHGIASALVAEVVSSQLRPVLRRPIDSSFQYPVEPASLVEQLNELFYNEFQPLGILLTFFIAFVDREAETITYAGAGHPPPILQCCSAHNIIELRSQNVVLGATEDCIIEPGQETLPIHPGDRIIFYTDGIIEANDGRDRMFGIEGLRDIIERHYDSSQDVLANDILSTARSIAGNNETDDMSLILLDVLRDP